MPHCLKCRSVLAFGVKYLCTPAKYRRWNEWSLLNLVDEVLKVCRVGVIACLQLKPIDP